MKKIPHPIAFPALLVCICLVSKWAFTQSDHANLLFILGPLDFLVSIFTNSKSVFLPSSGFYHESLQVLIDKSCAGVNFMILTFGSLYSLFYREQSPVILQVKNLAMSVLLAYIITLVANTSRVIVLITSLRFVSGFSWVETDWFHQAMGAFIYLSTLLIACIVVHKSLSKPTVTHA